MTSPHNSPRITLRIPGAWPHPQELFERLPEGFQLRPENLRLPDGTLIDLDLRDADRQFVSVFQTACRRPPQDDELETLGGYTVNVVLSGPGGSMESALKMMQAGAAIVGAGAAGVFIDNSALAFGGQDWIAMTDDGGPEAISFAFVSIIRGSHDTYTMGMQVLGFADLSMRTADIDERGEIFIELIRYVCRGDRPIDVGHILADELGPRFQVVSREDDQFGTGSPMHNPSGRLKIVSTKDIAERN